MAAKIRRLAGNSKLVAGAPPLCRFVPLSFSFGMRGAGRFPAPLRFAPCFRRCAARPTPLPFRGRDLAGRKEQKLAAIVGLRRRNEGLPGGPKRGLTDLRGQTERGTTPSALLLPTPRGTACFHTPIFCLFLPYGWPHQFGGQPRHSYRRSGRIGGDSAVCAWAQSVMLLERLQPRRVGTQSA
jgi:hypothetical protein